MNYFLIFFATACVFIMIDQGKCFTGTCLHSQHISRLHDKIITQELIVENFERNLPVDTLIKGVIERNEGVVTANGSISVMTGKFTGRSPEDRYIVDDNTTHSKIDWGKVNKPYSEQNFNIIYNKMRDYMKRKEVLVFDGYVGADEKYRVPIRVITDTYWQNLFVRQLFIRPTDEELETHVPEFTIISMNGFQADPKIDGTNSNAFVILNLSRKLILIGTTQYAGEMKKAMFSVMNYILPPKGVLPMHCSANIGKNGDTALFFGLSGTGKTTLSADPNRYLIGDDEHGWSNRGIFNFEGGCYAKCINLRKEAEPQIWNAITSGAVLENVVVDSSTKLPNFDDQSVTENTRVAYPIEYIPGAVIPSVGGHPKVIIFLTADAFGVLPPIARLTNEGAMYHFLSGYTSKLAGTERGITTPQATFSECFGSPFLPLHASKYAELLGEKLRQHSTKVYLINTGWTGGGYGVGKRMNIAFTRIMVNAALSGELNTASYRHDNLFNLDVPISINSIPSEVLNPKNTWTDKDAYDKAAVSLAQMFVKNFQKFDGKVLPEIIAAGPLITL